MTGGNSPMASIAKSEDPQTYAGLTLENGQPFEYPAPLITDCTSPPGYSSTSLLSTSVGSGDLHGAEGKLPSPKRRDAEVQCDSENLYTQPMYVQNTFIHYPCRTMSLDGFYKERQVHSCPASGNESHAARVIEGRDESGPPVLCLSEALTATDDPPYDVDPQDADEELEDIEPTEGLLSVGSTTHPFGCKPCAFFHLKGCANGLNCEFCHLCELGEKKRRKKEKMASKKWTRQLQQALPSCNFNFTFYSK